MNYFELYDLPVSVVVDQALVKKKYYQLSKEYHPDFYINESEEKQAEILELSTLNTNAYNTLREESKRIKYILDLYNQSDDTQNEKLPQSFLMEMMDLNEKLMDLEFDVDENVILEVKNELNRHQENILKLILPFSDDINALNDAKRKESINKLKDYYLKSKYLLRITERLDKFAAANK